MENDTKVRDLKLNTLVEYKILSLYIFKINNRTDSNVRTEYAFVIRNNVS